jgi:biopolymer transport protein ExbB
MKLPQSLAELGEQLRTLWSEATVIWSGGGWAMIAIAVIALAMFGIGMHIFLRLQAKRFGRVPERTWRRWIDEPEQRRGPVGELLEFVSGARSLKELAFYFDQLRLTEIVPFERDLKVMKICVSAAPLVGLLGTVTGMLTTFSALSSGSGGDKTMAMIAEGISEALITTETGLIIALPGLFFQYQLARSHDRYAAFLAHLESVCTQKLYTKLRAKGELRPRGTGGPRQGARRDEGLRPELHEAGAAAGTA